MKGSMHTLKTCPHKKLYAGSDEDGSIMWVCVACGARRFEKFDGIKGRMRHAPLVAAVIRDASR